MNALDAAESVSIKLYLKSSLVRSLLLASSYNVVNVQFSMFLLNCKLSIVAVGLVILISADVGKSYSSIFAGFYNVFVNTSIKSVIPLLSFAILQSIIALSNASP